MEGKRLFVGYACVWETVDKLQLQVEARGSINN